MHVDGADRLSIDWADGGEPLVRLAGELDAYTAPGLQDALEAAPGGTLRVDMSGVGFIDSTGIRVIVGTDNRRKDDGQELVLVGPSDAVRRLLQLTSLDQHLTIEEGS